MMLTWCATAALKKSFKLFQIHSYADTSWDDDRNSRKSTCSSCIMPFSHAQLNVLGRIYCDVIFSCRSYRYLCLRARSSVHTDISCRSCFLAICVCTVVLGMHRSRRAWALLRQVKTNSLFARWMFISDRDGIINFHPVPTSQQVADIDDNGHYGFALAFLQCLETS